MKEDKRRTPQLVDVALLLILVLRTVPKFKDVWTRVIGLNIFRLGSAAQLSRKLCTPTVHSYC